MSSLTAFSVRRARKPLGGGREKAIAGRTARERMPASARGEDGERVASAEREKTFLDE